MNLKVIGILISCLVAISMVISSCTSDTPQTTTTTTVTSTSSTPVVSTTTTAGSTTAAPTTTTVTTAPTTVSDEPKYGGTLMGAFWQGYGSMDPADSPNYSGYFFNQVFETMTQPDFAKGQAGTKEYDFNIMAANGINAAQRGRVAESWQIVDDTTINFTIRKGLRYTLDPNNAASILAGGREVTAQDMVYVLNRYTSNLSAPLPGRDFVYSWTATDKSTVVLKLKTPMFSFWIDIVNRIPGPYPPETVTKYGNLKDWKNWVGTGPFIMTDFVSDSSATFVKNPNYWGYDELHPANKLPYVDGVRILTITDTASRVAAFRTRKIDMMSGIDSNQLKSLQKTNPEIVTSPPSLTGNGRSFFNMNEPPFNDVRVRQAMWMAIDFDSVVRDYYGGIGTPRGFPMDMASNYYTPTDKLPTALVDPVTGAVTNLNDLWTYHPDKAIALLKTAGYANGFEFTMTVHSAYTEQALIFQSYWKAIGAKANIVVKDANATAALRYQSGGQAAFKGVLFIQSGGSSDPSDMDQQVHTNSAWNSGGFSSTYFDTTYTKLIARLDLGPVQKEMTDLSLWVMSQCIRLDFPLTYNYGVIHPWIKQYTAQGSITNLSYYYLNTSHLWIDQEIKSKFVR